MLIKKQKAREKSFKFSVVFGNRLGLLKKITTFPVPQLPLPYTDSHYPLDKHRIQFHRPQGKQILLKKTIEASKSASIHRWPNNCRKQMRLPSLGLSAFNPCESFQRHIPNKAQICSKLIKGRRKKNRTETDKTKCSYDIPIDRPDSR